MKGLYLLYLDLGQTGIDNKIKSQIRCFEEHGFEIARYTVPNDRTTVNKILARLPFTNVMPEWRLDIDLSEFGFIYMRRPDYMSHAFINFLKGIKEKYKTIKIFMEIPTYPYGKKSTIKFSDSPIFKEGRYARKSLTGLMYESIIELLNIYRESRVNT